MQSIHTAARATFALGALLATLAAPAAAQTSGATKPACKPGDPVVWENTSSKSKAYHTSDDKYFGNTKHGQYACESDAKAAGYHASSKSSKSSSSSASSASAAPSPAASASSHHHHHHGSSASPAPSPAAT